MTFQGGVSVFSNKLPLVVWLTAASQCFQKAKVTNFPTSLSFYSCVIIAAKCVSRSVKTPFRPAHKK